MGAWDLGGDHGGCEFERSTAAGGGGGCGGKEVAAPGGGAFSGERVVGDPLGGVAGGDRWDQSAASGRQEPLAAGAAFAMAFGSHRPGGGPDLGRDRAADLRGAGSEDDRGLDPAVLHAPQDQLPKKPFTPPNRPGPTWPRRRATGDPAPPRL